MSNWLIKILCVEYHTNCRGYYSILGFVWEVHYVHFKIKSLPIYSMFWISMEVELVRVKLSVSIKILWSWCVERTEILWFLLFIFIFYENFYSVICVPIYFLILNISITFLELILNSNRRKRITVHVISQVDWTLSVFSASWKIYFPIRSILWIIISLWWNLRKLLEVEASYWWN